MVQSTQETSDCVWEVRSTRASVHSSGKIVAWPIESCKSCEQETWSSPDGYCWGGVLTQSYGQAMACVLVSLYGNDASRTLSGETAGASSFVGGAALEPVLLLRTRLDFPDSLPSTYAAAEEDAFTAVSSSANGEQAIVACRSGYAYLFRGLDRYCGLARAHMTACLERRPWTESLPDIEASWSWLPFGTDAQVVVDCAFDKSAQFLACVSARGELRLYHIASRSVVHRFRPSKEHGLVSCIRFLDHEIIPRESDTKQRVSNRNKDALMPATVAHSMRDPPGRVPRAMSRPSKRRSLAQEPSPSANDTIPNDDKQLDPATESQLGCWLPEQEPSPSANDTIPNDDKQLDPATESQLGSLSIPKHAAPEARLRDSSVDAPSKISMHPPVLLIGCEDGTIYINGPSTGDRIRSVREHSSAVLHLGVVSNPEAPTTAPNLITSAGMEPFLIIWDERLQQPRQTLIVGESITAVLPIYDEQALAGWMVATMSGHVYFFPIEQTVTQRERNHQPNHWVSHPLGLRVESGSIRTIPQRAPEESSTLAHFAQDETKERNDQVAVLGLLAWPAGIAMHARARNKSTVLITASDQSLHLVQLSSYLDTQGQRGWRWQILATVMANLDEVYSLAIVPAQMGRSQQLALAYATNANAIAVTGLAQSGHLDSLSFQRTLIGHTDAVLCLSAPPALPGKAVASPDLPSSILVSVSKDATVRLWDMQRGQCCNVGSGHAAALDAVTCGWFQTRGSWRLWIASAGEDLALKLWTTAETKHSARSVSRDGAMPLTCWCTIARAHEREIHSLASAPNSKYIASGSQDKTVKLWRIVCNQDGHPEASAFRTLSGHRRSVWHVCFARTEPVLASASADRTIRVWSVPQGVCLRQIEAGGLALSTRENGLGSFLCGAFLDHDTKFVAGSAEGALYLWQWRTGELIGEICPRPPMKANQRRNSFPRQSAHHDRVWSLTTVETDQFPSTTNHESDVLDSRRILLLTGSADGTIKCWRDISAEERARRLEAQEARLLQDHQVQRAIARGHYAEALRGAIQLDQPFRAFTVLEKLGSSAFAENPSKFVEAIEVALRELPEPQDVWRVVHHIREWCAHRRTAFVAQVALRAVFRVYHPPAQLWSVLRAAGQSHDTLRVLQSSLMAFTERHANQLLRSQDELQLLAYAEMRLRLMAPDQTPAQDPCSTNGACAHETTSPRRSTSVSAGQDELECMHRQASPSTLQ
jgi:WD40 repeat protein